jgi:hypothetical protein
MAAKGNTFRNDLMKLIFQATAIANIADNAAAAPLANLYISLHTADPGYAGDQTTNEAAYTGYARQAVARTAGGFTVVADTVNPVANIDFPACTALPGAAITHWMVGTLVAAGGKTLYVGTLTPNVTMAVGVIPRVKNTSTVQET